MKKHIQGLFFILSIGLLSSLLTGCGQMIADMQADSQVSGNGGMGMGNGVGMMKFHMATIPDEYVSLSSPISDDTDSLERGQQIFTANCATCHGDGGMGDGPAGLLLDPSPAKIAHTSQMMSDAYLYWRISEGGTEFETAMIPFKAILSEEQRWDVINYVRALGAGHVIPMGQFGGETNDPAAEATRQAEMLSTGITQGVINEAEADLFIALHDSVDTYIKNNRDQLATSDSIMMEAGLDAMVVADELTREQADQFIDIHNRLSEAGLMN